MVLSKYINKASWKKRLQWVPASYKAAHLGGGASSRSGATAGEGELWGCRNRQAMVGEGDFRAAPESPRATRVMCGVEKHFRSAHNSFLIFSSVSRANLSPGVPKKAREDPLPVPSDQHSLPFL